MSPADPAGVPPGPAGRPRRPAGRLPGLRQQAVLHLTGGLALLVTVLVLIWLGVSP
jgi:hypothetical protein